MNSLKNNTDKTMLILSSDLEIVWCDNELVEGLQTTSDKNLGQKNTTIFNPGKVENKELFRWLMQEEDDYFFGKALITTEETILNSEVSCLQKNQDNIYLQV